ncbi:hypothetical protein NDU88_007313 [Pleurodeles waltl]|uniref:Uncharacterized protein n=1 Tax=Pleurodeles waltl TaxID=8319 RepID=A0AAV7QKC9_PLEWA|nr:hypothetical protein NDU88_007313 [Pleurodeles waltl]
MPVLNVRGTELKRKEGVEKRATFEEGGEEDWRRKNERGVSPEEVQEGEPPGETGVDNRDPKEPETSPLDDMPSTERNLRSNASHVPGGTWLSQGGFRQLRCREHKGESGRSVQRLFGSLKPRWREYRGESGWSARCPFFGFGQRGASDMAGKH